MIVRGEAREAFAFVLKLVHEHGLLKGKTLGVDSTTLEANAAMNRQGRHHRHGDQLTLRV